MRGRRTGFAVLCLLLAHGAALADELRVPQHPGATETMALPRSLGEGVRLFRAGIASPEFNAQTCASFLGAIYDNLWRAPVGHFDLREAKLHARTLVRSVFEAKLDLRRALVRMEAEGPVPPACVAALRNTMRASGSNRTAPSLLPIQRIRSDSEARIFIERSGPVSFPLHSLGDAWI
jgi:hypothetical protein